VRTGGRRGRRTARMVQVAEDRISDLFALAGGEAHGGVARLADRYVRLARRIGMRYNVRLLPVYSELYCRGCSSYWVEGRTVRTRLRSGRRVRTCLACGRTRRVPYRAARAPAPSASGRSLRAAVQSEVALSGGPLAAGGAPPEPDERDGR
jgi:ribonuclease P protein subunit RPR2